MTKEQALILELIRSSVTGQPVAAETDGIDWVSLIKETRAQTVALLVFDAASKIKNKIPENIYTEWFKISYSLMRCFSAVEKSQNELIDILAKGNYPYAILKGEAAASYYPAPRLRALGDVDFLIDPVHKQSIKALLIESGFESSYENHICHIVFTKPGSHLEMHFEIAGIPEGDVGIKVRNFMKDAVYETVSKNNGSGEFCALKEKYHAVTLLLHMQHHMLGEGIGLRHLLDWGCFVNKTVNEAFWTAELIPFLKEIGLNTYMNVMTGCCCEYFGIVKPDWLEITECEVCREVMEDILDGGNFGKKDKLRGRVAIRVTGKDKSVYDRLKFIYKTLKNSTEDLYPVVKKYKLLYPFIYFYRIMRYLILVRCGKKPSILGTSPTADKRVTVYNKLHIFEVTGNE